MPYATNDALPAAVKDAIPSSGGKRLFRNVVNGQLKAGKSEAVAFASAWAALQGAGYKKDDDGKWVKKSFDWIKSFADGINATMSKTVTKGDSNYAETISSMPIIKKDEEQRIVWGWASVVTEKGEPVVDSQDHIIEPHEMEIMANEFMLSVRTAKAMHDGDSVGEVIHSMPLTKELGEALGIQSDREGWIIAMKVKDDGVWQRVKNGELQAFSIGGKTLMEDADA